METPYYISGGGEMGALMRALDWSATSVGPMESWPEALKTTLAILLRSPVPMCLCWGPDLACLSNDPFRLLVENENRQSVLCRPFREVWPEIWDSIRTTIEQVLEKGEGGVWNDLHRTFSLSPVPVPGGRIGGILVTASEHVTEEKISGAPTLSAMQASELEMIGLFEEAPFAIATLSADEDLRFLSANRFYGELVGRRPGDLIRQPLLEALPEIRSQGFYEILQGVIANGVSYTAYEVPVQLTRDNRLETVYLNFSYIPRLGADHRVVGILVTAIDVSYQVYSRRAIEENEALFRSVIQAAPFPIGVYIGETLRIRYANPAIIEVYGKGPDVIGKNYLDVVPELMEQGIGKQVIDVYRSGRPFFSDTSRVDIDVNGETRTYYFEYNFIPLLDAAGKVYGVLNTGFDVTEVELARQRAQQAEAGLRFAVEVAELADWSIDRGTRVLHVSQRLQTWMGIEENLIGLRDFFQLIPEEHLADAISAYEGVFSKKDDATFEIEHPLVDKRTGSTRFIHARGQLIRDAAGRVIRLTGTMQDITQHRAIRWDLERQVAERTAELERKNAELKHSNDELSQYAYVTSHDLQEPLRKIRMYISWLCEKFSMPPESAEILHKITKSSARMTQLIQDLLAFSRLVGSNLHMQRVDLNQIVGNVLEDFELSVMEKRASVHIDTLPAITGVSLHLNQLFHNLIGNALKFVDPHRAPVIKITARRLQRQEVTEFIPQTNCEVFYDIAVADNGIGFEQEYSEYVFELFKQLHSRNRYPGSGIGLSLCRRIAANHGGYIYATSVPGEGSVFHLLVPGEP